ncbi:hypothetical protein GCM10010274_34850 [Streptomyces lavendofoliae]|uniref:Uncharacterized protein n=1 Tax=Streptomyces lavendofoliae TaxID=67314 RepID=A0A918HXY5_9ACTN|nr:hypothetical protein GCM10010274_34850 [Streptomyces lavendofoliae]
MIVPSSREETSRSPSGRAARPHGDFSPSVSVDTTATAPFAGGADGPGEDGEPDGSAEAAGGDPALRPAAGWPPEPDEHPAARSRAAANTAVTAGRCTVDIPSAAM